MLALERDDSALLPGMFRLAVTAPDEQQPTIQVVNGPFALVGRTDGCTCRFDHPAVGRRHAYLQALYGRIYCIDLGSVGGTFWGDSPRPGGWVDPEDVIRIGPYQVRLVDTMGLGTGSEELSRDFNPLDRYAGDVGPLPKIGNPGPRRRAACPLHHQPADHARRQFVFLQVASGGQKRLLHPLQSLMAARRPVGRRFGGKGWDERAGQNRAVCETGRGGQASRRQVLAARALSWRAGGTSSSARG